MRILVSKLFFYLLFGFFLMSITPQVSFGQKAVEKAEKNKEKHKKSQEEIQKELIKRHLKIQDKETRKRIKRSKREAERRKKGKPPVPWYRRIFQHKQSKKRSKKS